MRTFKKFLVLLTFVLLIGSLTACSSINKITKNFKEAGYNYYEYNFKGDSLLFSDVDAIVEDLNITIIETTVTTEEFNDITTTSTLDAVTTVTINQIANVIGFSVYAFTDSRDIVVVVIEFESEARMNEVLDQSPTLQALVEGLDEADYINGNCLLIADAEVYEEVVEIFQGRYIPEENPTTEEPTTEAPTTVLETTTN
jgi:arsenate reductase-like glutaredoxin family protein